jgi:hypothetical protein
VKIAQTAYAKWTIQMVSQTPLNKVIRFLCVSLTLIAICSSRCEICDKEASMYTLYPCRFNKYDPEIHTGSPKYTLNHNEIIGVYIDLPDKVVVRVDFLEKFSWKDFILPIGLAYKIDKPCEDGSTPLFAFFKDTDTEDIFHFQLFRYVFGIKLKEYSPHIVEWIHWDFDDTIVELHTEIIYDLSQNSLLYDLAKCYSFPKYTAQYEVWITAAGIKSNISRLTIEVYENGTLVQHP